MDIPEGKLNCISQSPTEFVVRAFDKDEKRFDTSIQVSPSQPEGLAPNSIVIAGDGGEATAGEWGIAIAGEQGAAKSLRSGLAYVISGQANCEQPKGIAIAHKNGIVTAANLLAATFHGGSAIMSGAGIAIALNDFNQFDAQAAASDNGLIVLGYMARDPVKGDIRQYVVCKVGEDGIKANTPYKLDDSHNVIEATTRA